MDADRSPILFARVAGRPLRARVLTALTGAAIGLLLADLAALGGVGLSERAGTTVLPLATALVAAGLVITRLLWAAGDRAIWTLLAIGLCTTALGTVLCHLVDHGRLVVLGAPDAF